MGTPAHSRRSHRTYLSNSSITTSTMADIDMNNRDPNNINDHLRVTFEDVLAEPEGIHSMNCVWSNSYKCFNCCKSLCYTIMTLCCGICIAAEWGCEFAEIAFCHIWYVTPCFKVCELNCGCPHKLPQLPSNHRLATLCTLSFGVGEPRSDFLTVELSLVHWSNAGCGLMMVVKLPLSVLPWT